MIIINISKDFSKTPGARYKNKGDYSGELFREEYLEPKYKDALKTNIKLKIIFDGCYGFPTSFLEESFGGLIRKGHDAKDVLERIVLISNENPTNITLIKKYINNAQKK